MRPPNVWNFVQDPAEEQLPHVLRAKACPQKCYEDGRVEKIQEAITLIGRDLLRYEEATWNRLCKQVMEVFRHLNKKYAESLAGENKE